MKPSEDTTDHQDNRFSRRAFLGAAGAGAVAAVALDFDAAIAAAAQAEADGTLTNNFGRIFNLPAFAPANDTVRAGLMEMGKLGGILDAKDPLHEGPIRLITNPELSPNNVDNPFHTAGTTFLGQFLDHDMTFDQTSPLGVTTDPTRSRNTRTPAFDLDSVYGGGPSSSPQFYDPSDRAKFRIESGGRFEDLPRRSDGSAIISDPRNDENLMISGMHAAFLKFHNRCVDRVRSQGSYSPFSDARRLVTWHYQWIILKEFLPLIIGQPLIDHILHFGRQFYRPSGASFIPVEFQIGYRFGHTMIRPSYRANLAGDANNAPFFGFIFDPVAEGQADPVDLRGGKRAARRFIGWQTFFDFGDGNVRPNKRIDTKISTPLFQLPLFAIPSGDPPISLPQRNLLRHLTWSLPSGQRIARTMGIPTIDTSELGVFGIGLENSAPLWYYIIKEGEALGDGRILAGVGARLIGEVFIGLLQRDTRGFLYNNPRWRPTLPSRTAGDFRMVDLLTFARVDPTSRGQ